jgi:hypothetical protein
MVGNLRLKLHIFLKFLRMKARISAETRVFEGGGSRDGTAFDLIRI